MSEARILCATPSDVDAIAALHAHSWRATYGETLPAGPLLAHLKCEHASLWRARLSGADDPALRIWKACAGVDDGPLAGFICALSGADGILIDNLHVAAPWQGRGIGQALFMRVRDWAGALDPNAPLYLWVLAQNTRARRFYDRMGGLPGPVHPIAVSPGIEVPALRYLWAPMSRESSIRKMDR
ncbi:N-acetyltransferase [Pandoraea pneumonica]|uniref:N-acetyltransferase n=1 Tax=Pandoraea pneumonica TaxID=2508299 RepID=A0A5E4TBW0_9BURK|nr:GNAT family N-acetyltransferase [Pandoraea pneumonica]VVD83894.1 N-acetyltransferase [Pandoraea pneumonica]